VFDYYPDMSSPVLVNFGSRGVTAGALLPGWAIYTSHLEKCLHTNHTWEKTSQRGCSVGSRNWPWLGGAVGIAGGGVA